MVNNQSKMLLTLEYYCSLLSGFFKKEDNHKASSHGTTTTDIREEFRDMGEESPDKVRDLYK